MENPTKLTKNVQKYIELVYSEKSKLNEIIDLTDRKLEACNIAKLDSKSPEVVAIMEMKDETVSPKIIDYLIANNSYEFTLLLADQHLFTTQIKQMLDPTIDIMIQNKLSENSDKLLLRIKARMQLIFQGDAESKLAGDKIRIMRPEDRIRQKSA